MRVVTFDVETTIHDGTPSPYDARNKVVLWGWMLDSEEHTDPTTDIGGIACSSCPYDNIDLLVGQNLSFDIAYALRDGVWDMHSVPKNIWDIQLAEYLLTGQTHKYASMDDMAKKYGLALKDDKVKVFFDAGKGADEIPLSILTPYLEHDLTTTYRIYQHQRAKAEEKGMMPLILSQMRARFATIIMEWNGLQINWGYVNKKCAELEYNLSLEEGFAREYAYENGFPIDAPFNVMSVKHLSALFFGTPVKWKERVQDGVYKNGKPKWKLVEKEWKNPKPLRHPTAKEVNGRGEYPVDDEVLAAIETSRFSSMVSLIRSIRTQKKWKETYYENLKSFRSSVDDRVHPSLNHCVTDTGRLSCTKPNIQNQTTEGGIKDAYVSRFGRDGVLLDIDYSQLEVVGLAAITQDKQLLFDINNSLDIHTELFKDMYGYTPDKNERKAFKPRTFLTIYGGGANALSTQTGISKKEAQRFIDVFYKRYPGVKAWHDFMVEEAKKSRVVTKERSPTKRLQVGAYVYKSLTGRRYVFKEWENEWSDKLSFSPTQLKNWPVQGFATGDIVPHMLGHIVSTLQDVKMLHTIFPICTVHDSLLFDVHKDNVKVASEALCAILSQTKSLVQAWFGLPELNVEFKVEANAGPTWGSVAPII
jgi:DNA polymerase I